MTRKEAIEELKAILEMQYWNVPLSKAALDMAIASLETDEAYQLEYERTTKNDLGVASGTRKKLEKTQKKLEKNSQKLENVSPIIDWNNCHTSKQLESMATTKNDLGVDAVSRKQAIEEADKLCLETGYDNEKVIEMLNELPSVTPIRPKGRWIDKQHLCGYCSAECSSCHKRSNGYVHDNGFSLEHKYYDFCPNCGAKMVEPQESEDKP